MCDWNFLRSMSKLRYNLSGLDGLNLNNEMSLYSISALVSKRTTKDGVEQRNAKNPLQVGKRSNALSDQSSEVRLHLVLKITDNSCLQYFLHNKKKL